MAAAYAYAVDEGEAPRELVLMRYIDRFGLGVLGRTPGAGELRRMSMADRVVRAYQMRQKSGNWPAWAEADKEGARLLSIAERLYNGE